MLILAVFFALAACGGGPEADVSIFVMTQPAPDMTKVEQMETVLQEKVGESPTVDLSTSPLFSLEKLVVEIAAGGHGILILNEEQMRTFAAEKSSLYPLDDTFPAADYPQGLIEVDVQDEKGNVTGKETGFYVMPVEDAPWFQLGGYAGPPAYAFIPANAPNPELAKQVLKAMVEYR
jgi:predicted nucleotidyltransferase